MSKSKEKTGKEKRKKHFVVNARLKNATFLTCRKDSQLKKVYPSLDKFFNETTLFLCTADFTCTSYRNLFLILSSKL